MNVTLTEVQPSDRLKELVEKIDGLTLKSGNVLVVRPEGTMGYSIYDCRTNTIGDYCRRTKTNTIGDYCRLTKTNTYIRNPLLNKKKLTNRKVKYISEANFCDLLLEHLYLSAKLKLEELLPQIQELEPSAKLNINDSEGYMTIYVKGVSVVSTNKELDYQLISTNRSPHIWEDKAELVVKKSAPKEWWKEPTPHYVIYISSVTNKFTVGYGNTTIREEHYGLVNKTIFETEEEAQHMTDKLNKAMEE